MAGYGRSLRAAVSTVYIDYLQNIEGKTLATAYAVRANEFAGVSTPLRWEELDRPDLHQDRPAGGDGPDRAAAGARRG